MGEKYQDSKWISSLYVQRPSHKYQNLYRSYSDNPVCQTKVSDLSFWMIFALIQNSQA